MDTVINYSGLALGIILAIIGIILQIRSNRKKEPVYSIKSNNLISDYTSEYKKLKVSYDRKKVENLTVSKVLFYNRGSETITFEDIHTKNCPRIIAKEGVKILEASILQINNPSSEFFIPTTPYGFTALNEGREVLIGFKYLDKNQGAVYQIIHTGLLSEDLAIEGDVIGVQKLVKVSPDKFPPPPKLLSSLRNIGSRVVLMALLLYLMYLGNMLRNPNVGFLIVFSAFLFGIFDIIPLVFKMLRGRILPKGLEKFNE